MTVIDLTHPISAGMRTYPGLPGPTVRDHLSFAGSRSHYAPGTEFRISTVELLTSTGTYLDAPQHRFVDGADIAAIGLERCIDLPCVVVDTVGVDTAGVDTGGVDTVGSAEIPDELVPREAAGCAVLFRTGWDAHWGTDRYGADEHPHLSAAAASVLARSGAVLVGIDSVNVDGTVGGERPVHTELLAHGVLIVENLTNLRAVPTRGAEFSAVPLPFRGLPSFPVRAFVRC